MGSNQDRQAMAAIALLADELRQRLYRFVAAQPGPVTRDEAAAAVGISRKLAAFHLDKLTAAGLLETAAPRPGQPPPRPRPGPQGLPAGRDEVAISVPQRRYDALGEVLAQAIVAEGPARSAPHTAQQPEQLAVATGTGESSHPASGFPWAVRICQGGCYADNQL
jgi:DNA-binding transcriptional ArsR family regulator